MLFEARARRSVGSGRRQGLTMFFWHLTAPAGTSKQPNLVGASLEDLTHIPKLRLPEDRNTRNGSSFPIILQSTHNTRRETIRE